MFNILHLSDIHLGAVPYGMRERGRDIDRCLTWIGSLLVHDRFDAIVLAGDTFDRAQINPMDHSALRNLLALATQRHIPVYWIEGDHDSVRRDKVRRDGQSWPEVFQDNFFVCPEQLNEDGLPVPYVLEKEDHQSLTICPVNWRPGAEIRELMSRLPDGYCDLMIMHQSLEGVIPAIACELRVEDIDGKAKHFALGDLHVNHAAILPSGAVAAYPGPIEWLATDQAGQVGFRAIAFHPDGSWASSVHTDTPARKLLSVSVAVDEIIDLTRLMPLEEWPPNTSGDFVEVGSPGNSVRIRGAGWVPERLRHSYFFDIRYFHSPGGDTKDLGESVKSYIQANVPGALVRVSQVPSVDSASTYTEDRSVDDDGNSTTLSMEEAIRQSCADDEDPSVLQTALDIWSHPENVKNIIERRNEAQETENP